MTLRIASLLGSGREGSVRRVFRGLSSVPNVGAWRGFFSRESRLKGDFSGWFSRRLTSVLHKDMKTQRLITGTRRTVATHSQGEASGATRQLTP